MKLPGRIIRGGNGYSFSSIQSYFQLLQVRSEPYLVKSKGNININDDEKITISSDVALLTCFPALYLIIKRMCPHILDYMVTSRMPANKAGRPSVSADRANERGG